MNHDYPDPSLHSRMCMSSRMLPQPSKSTRRRRLSSSSGSTDSRPTPLTPRNTFNDLDYPDPLSAEFRLQQLELGVPNLDDEFLDHVETKPWRGRDCNDESGSTASLCWPESPTKKSAQRSGTKPNVHAAATSAPVSVLKSSHGIGSPQFAPVSQPVNSGTRRAHFDDDLVTTDVLLRRAATNIPLQRRRSDPARLSDTRDAADVFPSLGNDEDQEADHVFAAVGMLELLHDIIESGEEHEGIHRHRRSPVDHQTSDTSTECDEFEYEGDDEDWNESAGNSLRDSSDDANDTASAGHIRQTSADEDVDETCMEAEGIAKEDFAGEDLELEWAPKSRLRSDTTLTATNSRIRKSVTKPIANESNGDNSASSAETVIRSAKKKVPPDRRASEPHTQSDKTSDSQCDWRSSSMTNLKKCQGKAAPFDVSYKASPASPAVTICSVRKVECPKPNEVYQHPEAADTVCNFNKINTKTAQTVRSETGTFKMIWDEPSSSANSCVTLLEASDIEQVCTVDTSQPLDEQTHIPMDKVKTKLAAWSWAREHGIIDADGNPAVIPLLSFEADHSQRPSIIHTPHSEGPVCPPNTERQSGASSGKQSGTSTGKHSATRSPPNERESLEDEAEDDDEEEDELIELKVKAVLALPPKTKRRENPNDHLDVPILQFRNMSFPSGSSKYGRAISRELSNLAAEDKHFKTHRDSLVLLRKREHDEEAMNQYLANSQDSMILTRLKFDERYPDFRPESRTGWSRQRDLSPIPDASPSVSRRHSGGEMRQPGMPKSQET